MSQLPDAAKLDKCEFRQKDTDEFRKPLKMEKLYYGWVQLWKKNPTLPLSDEQIREINDQKIRLLLSKQLFSLSKGIFYWRLAH